MAEAVATLVLALKVWAILLAIAFLPAVLGKLEGLMGRKPHRAPESEGPAASLEAKIPADIVAEVARSNRPPKAARKAARRAKLKGGRGEARRTA